MRVILILLISIPFSNWTSAQSTDSIKTFKKVSALKGFYDTKGSKKWITKDHVTIVTTKLQLTQVEEKIAELESEECSALLNRDTAALKNIWLKDFTLDEPQTELFLGKNPIPYYTSFNRTIEKFNAIDNVVYTSGYEYKQQLNINGKVDDPIKRNYFHMWIMKFGTWKLATKTYE